MKRFLKTSVALLSALVMAFTGAFIFNGLYTPAYADVGSVADDEDVQYDKDGGVLSSLGIDTSKMPDTYDPDATGNPYGSDVTNMNAVYELFQFDTASADANLYGHNVKLDGKYDTLMDGNTAIKVSVPGFTTDTFADCAPCDIKGTGRDSALAIVYTNYNPVTYDPDHPEQNDIYLIFYDPHSGDHSAPIKISSFIGDRITASYLVQSQLQVTCGDYDNDSIDEVAVYVPAASDNERAKVTVFDLVNGKDSADPFSSDAWNLSWNYILPVTSESSKVVAYLGESEIEYFKNFYNNIDLVSGDADNDGPCDLVISYGASSTGAEVGELQYDKIIRSIDSHSILLFGSNEGQMLKKTQELSYDDNDLIRVSCAFGDLNDDGNEEMLLGGQLKDEQDTNTSRVLGKFIYDHSSNQMIPEQIDNIDVVDGTTQDDGQWSSSNGWDAFYYSTPVMKTNIAVGKFFGEQSDKRIYLDSVLYSYNGSFAIEDELEDVSTEKDKDNNDIPKGSRAMADMKGIDSHSNEQWEYFEYGAQAANFTGSDFDYALISRVSKPKAQSGSERMEAIATRLVVSGNDLDNLKMEGKNQSYTYASSTKNSPFIFAVPDTDIDGTVAEYTGNHKIIYDDPKVVAVLASAPYFQDVANYDDSMLGSCSTGFGSGSGEEKGYEYTEELNVGIVGNIDFEAAHFFVDGGMGKKWSWEWGNSTSKEFTMSYETEGGEDAVVLQSTPHEYFEYNVTSVMVDDDGNVKSYTDTMFIKNPHQPVTQTLPLEDYIEIQKEYSKILPDVKQYYKCTAGDPSTYPKNENDIPKIASDNLKKDDDGEDLKYAAKDFAGIAFGGGSVSQSFSVTSTTSTKDDNEMIGMYQEASAGGEGGVKDIITLQIGVHEDFSRADGSTKSTTTTKEYSCTVANMPRSAKDYGYDFSWKLFEYTIDFTNEEGLNYDFPIVTYITDDVLSPPSLPEQISQDFDQTTDTQTALTWTYNTGTPQEFLVYKYLDFPQGGGDLLAGTVAGSDYKIKKDENGHTVLDSDGNVVREYTFIDSNLTPDTKYQYRVKIRRSKFPQESIFSPVIVARTDVSNKPDVTLSSNDLKIYPDGVYRLGVVLADPENYEGTINYQWQKFDGKKRQWIDVDGCTKRAIAFYSCSKYDAGTYRCRVNLIRKVEGNPQYISTYTDTCEVGYAKRSVVFGDIKVFDGEGYAPVNTGVSVSLANSSTSSVEKPTGFVQFKIEGANITIYATAQIDEATGIAKIDSLEAGMSSLDVERFTDGGYKITATYGGSNIFYAADDPDEYHYLRNIDECLWLSARTSYIFGEDIMKTTGLYDYKKGTDGQISRTDVTDQVKTVKFYAVDEDGKKTGDAVATYNLADTDGKAFLPLNIALAKHAYVEVFTDDASTPAGSAAFDTEKMITKLTLKDKMTGTGDLQEFYDSNDIVLSGDGNLTEQNIVTTHGNRSLAELLLFKYYEENGDFICDSTSASQHKDEFIPAAYVVKLDTPDPIEVFYKLTLRPADYTVVGNYYKVKAACSDENAGVVSMISPDRDSEYTEAGYAGGTKLVFKAVPDKGYQVKRWKINECGENEFILPASDTITYTVKSQTTYGTGEINITAILEPKDNTLHYGFVGQGSVEVTPQIENGSVVIADTDLTFKAIPAEGWKFKEWKWINDGGSNSIANGIMAEDGTNTKTFTMPDNSVTVYGTFMRETIDLEMDGDLDAAYINDGSNPTEETGKIIDTDSGQDVPKGAKVIVSTKAGYALAPDAEWKVTITTPDGTYDADVETHTYNGQNACKFTLPDDVTACQVAVETEKGKYGVDASADDVQFEIKVDGVVAEGSSITGIESGASVEIKALPERGRILDHWIINGETLDSNDTVYITTLTESLSVSAATAEDEPVGLKLKTSGGGTAKYVITDKSGRTYSEDFGETEVTPHLFKGESLQLSASDKETKHTMTAVSLNGKNVPLDDDLFELKDITEDLDIICRFTSSTYCSIGFDIQTRYAAVQMTDADGIILDEGESISVPRGGNTSFKVIMNKDYNCFVTDGDTKLKPTGSKEYDNSNMIYTYEISDIETSKALVVRDFDTYYIETAQDLKDFFELLNDHWTVYPDAVLKNDIVLDASEPSPSTWCHYNGVFDGQGHTISNMQLNPTFFHYLTASGCIKNVVLENVTSRVQAGWGIPSAIVVDDNDGTIEGVVLKNAAIYQEPGQARRYFIAGLVANNYGTVRDCKVSGLRLLSTGTDEIYDPIGCAGVIRNNNGFHTKAIVENNYFEDITRTTHDGEVPANYGIVATHYIGDHNGVFKGNYYKTTYNSYDPNGINVYTLTEHPDDEASATEEVRTAAFARKLAYTMNASRGAKIWGTTGNDDAVMLQIANCVDKNRKAPVKADFVTANQTASLYLYPGSYALPGRDTFGDNTPEAWECGDRAYSPDYEPVEIIKDSEFTGIDNTGDYVARLSTNRDGRVSTEYYKDFSDALRDAANHEEGVSLHLAIIGECTMEDIEFTVDPSIVVNIQYGAKLTIKKSASIINKSSFTISEGAELHKYGTIHNKASMYVDGTFYNYGSKLTNEALIMHQDKIICKPHCVGKWSMADKPNDDGTWTKKAKCEVCTHELTEKINPNPEPSGIDNIRILTPPEKDVYEVGEAFANDGMIVMATLNDGDKAIITDYTMTIDDKELKNGDILDTEGLYNVTVNYDHFTCGFDLDVMNTVDLLTITDESGKEITEAEMKANDLLELDATLKHTLAQAAGFLFETSDPDVVGIDNTSLESSHKILALKPGTATITVTVVDENENPINGIQPKSVEITVLDHITDIEIIGGDKVLDIGDSVQLQAKVVPEDTTDQINWSTSDEDVVTVDEDGLITAVGGGKAIITVASPDGISSSITVSVYEKAGALTLDATDLDIMPEHYAGLAARVMPATANGTVTWTVDNPKVAGFYVRDEKTGDMTIVKETTTELSADGSDYSDSYVIIAGIATGEAVVTASTDGQDGSTLSQQCQVHISEADAYVTMTQNGAAISGKLMRLNIDGRIIQLGAESSIEEDVLTWSVIDDAVSPVLKVNSTGKVTMMRPGFAIVKVQSETTGAMDVCAVKVKRNATGIVLSDKSIRLAAGETQVLIGTLQPEDAEDDIIWTSSDESVATVAKDGTVTAIADGTAIISAKPDNNKATSDSCEVTVYEPFLRLDLSKELFTFNGNMHYPSVTVRAGRTILGENITKSNDKVILSYDGGRRLPGMYTVTAVATDKSYGFGTAAYKIQVKPTKLKKVKKGKKSFTAKWKKLGKKYITGYQVKYSLNEDFSKAKIKTIKKYKKSSVKIKKLKAGKKYYVKVRTFVKRSGVKYYSDWSDIKTVTPKK